jgi:hypothetical protein
MTIMKDEDWKAAEDFAREIREYDEKAAKELSKVLTFVARRRSRGSSVGKDLDLMLDRLAKSGNMFAHTQNTSAYYQAIQKARSNHLRGIDDGERLAQIIGWAKRLAPVQDFRSSLSGSYSGKKEEPKPQVNAQLQKLAALKESASSGETATAVAEPPKEAPLKSGDKIKVTVLSIQGANAIAQYNSNEIRVPKQYGWGEGMEMEVELLSPAGDGIWKAKFRKKV